ncbi:CsbD family protein [Streptomyces sp. NBC_01617]|uniref:CsbD family protein n=1 Tax=unclassified Streptomyces TaxID=2593676 RepID=UPI003863D847
MWALEPPPLKCRQGGRSAPSASAVSKANGVAVRRWRPRNCALRSSGTARSSTACSAPDQPGRGHARRPLTGHPPDALADHSQRTADHEYRQEARHKAEAVKGGAKKSAGRGTGSRRLQAEGRGDQVKGNLKQAGSKIKDAFKH